MATIAIATQNQVKIRAIEKAFELFLGTSSNDVISIETKSGVGEQPFNKKVDEGAENRLRNLKSALSYRKDIDYYVACEGGVVKIFGQYYNVHVVIVEDRKGPIQFPKNTSLKFLKPTLQMFLIEFLRAREE